MTIFSAGVFAGRAADDDEHAQLYELVVDIGQRAFDARLGRRRIPEHFDEQLWRTLDETGLTRLTSTAELEAGPCELAIVLAGIARFAGAVPLAETDLLAGWLGTAIGLDLPQEALTVAIADAQIGEGRVRGTALDVPWTRAAGVVLLMARADDEARAGLLDLDRVDLVEGHNLAGEPRDRVSFDLPSADFTVVDVALAEELVRRGSWCRCVQIIGTLDAAAAMCVQHTREREQFGRALSKFQSVQHALASMAGEIERARAATALAVAAAADYGFGAYQTDYATTVARVAVGRAITPVTTIAHQLLGAIGVTAEHPLWSVTMRAQSWATEYGTTQGYVHRLGRVALEQTDPWDLVIGNF